MVLVTSFDLRRNGSTGFWATVPQSRETAFLHEQTSLCKNPPLVKGLGIRGGHTLPPL